MMKTMKKVILLVLALGCCLPVGGAEFTIPETDDGLPGEGTIRRYGWFKGLWEKKRSGWGERVEADRGAVVFFGDSITQGWGDGFKGAFGGLKVANRGISGDTTRGMLLRLEDDVLALQPKAVVMLMGTNDLEEGDAPEVTAGNVELILEAMKAHDAEMPIVLCKVMPSSASKKRPAAAIEKINALYAAVVKGDPQVTVVDTWKQFADANGDAKKAEFPDLLHPNDAGYAKWAAALRPIFATLGFLETAADDFEVEEGFESLFNGKDLTGWGVPEGEEAGHGGGVRWQEDEQREPLPGDQRSAGGGDPAGGEGADAAVYDAGVPGGFCVEVRVPSDAGCGQRGVFAQAAAAVPGLPGGGALQGSEELQAAGLEPDGGGGEGWCGAVHV